MPIEMAVLEGAMAVQVFLRDRFGGDNTKIALSLLHALISQAGVGGAKSLLGV